MEKLLPDPFPLPEHYQSDVEVGLKTAGKQKSHFYHLLHQPCLVTKNIQPVKNIPE